MTKYCWALAAVVAVAPPVAAQDAHPFSDGWFWGLKTGLVNVGTSASPGTTRPTYGAEWLITRTRGGLYVSADYGDFDTRATIQDPSTASGRRLVEVNNLRRVGFAALAFPRTFGRIRPYAGGGLTLNVLGRARAVPDSDGSAVDPSVTDAVEEARSRAALLVMAGVQLQFGRIAPFTQFTLMPSTKRFLLSDRSLKIWEIGARYNFGTSFDRPGRKR